MNTAGRGGGGDFEHGRDRPTPLSLTHPSPVSAVCGPQFQLARLPKFDLLKLNRVRTSYFYVCLQVTCTQKLARKPIMYYMLTNLCRVKRNDIPGCFHTAGSDKLYVPLSRGHQKWSPGHQIFYLGVPSGH